MQPPRRIPRDIGQPHLDIRMNILQRIGKVKFLRLDLPGDLREACIDGLRIRRRDDAGGAQHRRMGAAAGDILPPELAVEPD